MAYIDPTNDKIVVNTALKTALDRSLAATGGHLVNPDSIEVAPEASVPSTTEPAPVPQD